MTDSHIFGVAATVLRAGGDASRVYGAAVPVLRQDRPPARIYGVAVTVLRSIAEGGLTYALQGASQASLACYGSLGLLVRQIALEGAGSLSLTGAGALRLRWQDDTTPPVDWIPEEGCAPPWSDITGCVPSWAASTLCGGN